MKDRIRELMEAKHMNQQTFSNYTGINTATLSGILTGRTQATIKVVNSIRNKFPNVNISWLMFGEGEMFGSSNPTPQSPSADHSNGTLFSESRQTVAATSQPTVNSNTTPHPNVYPAQQTTQKTVGNGGANMAVEPSFFDEPKPQPVMQNSQSNSYAQPAQSAQHHQPAQPAQHHQQNITSIQIEKDNTTTLPKRHVTEIRIFYDDQTWEAFVPKNQEK